MGYAGSCGGHTGRPLAQMHMTLRPRLTEKLGIKHPVLLVPMGNIARQPARRRSE